ncbi:DnaJ-domain-containing protein [Wilcoxina mikolae CBS 423.85]|nr:DnaJ-domain-containing protein [Wilcoxina mikolae CBS 423.85]
MSDSENDELPPNAADLDPYAILNVPSTSTAAEIRSAYRKLALKCHPDKVPVAERDTAHAKFQELAFAYAILSDETRRKRYDTTGNTQESVLDDEGFDWKEYFKEQFRAINVDVIEEFKKGYKGGEEERTAILEAYTQYEGSLDAVFEVVLTSSVLEDEERFRAIIDKAIADGEVEAFKAYTKESEASKKRRRKAAASEAKEAEEYAKKLGVHDKLFEKKKEKGAAAATKGKKGKKGGEEEDTSALEALIKSRQANRMDAMIAGLEAKYASPSSTKKKGTKRAAPPQPTEEEFAAVGARAGRKKRAKT